MPPREWKDQLIPNIVDHLAKVDPDALYAEYPVSTLTYDEGYRRVTISDFANAVNCVAFWLHDTLGPPAKNLEVLAYIGPNDLRYPALVLGAAKAGYVVSNIFTHTSQSVLLTKQRSSLHRPEIVLEHNLIYLTFYPATPFSRLLHALHRPLQSSRVMTNCEYLRSRALMIFLIRSTHIFRSKSPSLRLDKNLFLLCKWMHIQHINDSNLKRHTSGSTGFPKPIPYTHDGAAKSINMMSLDPPAGFESLHRMYQKKRVFLTFPPFHASSPSLYFSICIY